MTVKELIAALERYPEDADVIVDNLASGATRPVIDVTDSEDNPEHEVYLEI